MDTHTVRDLYIDYGLRETEVVIADEAQAEIDELREALKFTHTELDKHHPYYSTLPMFNKYELLAHKQEKE